MTSERLQQFRVEMPDGLIIERLPVGLARGVWRLAFVASGQHFIAGDPPRTGDFFREFWDRVALDGLGARAESLGGGSGGGDDEYEIHWNVLDNGLTSLQITYMQERGIVASETIRLRG